MGGIHYQTTGGKLRTRPGAREFPIEPPEWPARLVTVNQKGTTACQDIYGIGRRGELVSKRKLHGLRAFTCVRARAIILSTQTKAVWQ